MLRRLLAELTRKQIQCGVRLPVAELEVVVDAHSDNPKPYKWVKSADKTLASVKRFCQKTLAGTSDSGDWALIAEVGGGPEPTPDRIFISAYSGHATMRE